MTPRLPLQGWPRRAAVRVLAPGRAVAFWQRSVTREARRASRLGRLAAWVRGLTADAPTLRADDPLGALADALERPAAGTEARQRRSARATGAEEGPRAARRQRPGPPGKRGRGTADSLVPQDTAAAARAHAAQPRVARLRRRLPDSPSTRWPGSASARVEAVTGGRTPSLGELAADRALRRLLSALPVEARATLGHGPPAHESAPGGSAEAAFASGITQVALATQWSAALGGRRAPRDLLWRLSESPRLGAVEAPVRDRAPGPTAERSAPPGNGGTGGAAMPAQAPPPLTRAAVRAAADPLRALAAEVPAQGLEPPAEAAARLRLAAVEAAPPGEDLAVLAGRVKRILDEEARRHGIDV